MGLPAVEFDVPPFRLSGVVLGCLLNHAPALAAMGPSVDAPPYKAAPRAPVLYVKPRNTLVGDGATVELPRDVPTIEVGAALGLVIGRTACRVSLADALGHVCGMTLVADLQLPHTSFYRPSVRLKARDGFCPLGPRVVPLREPDAQTLRVFVDGQCVHTTTTAQRVRDAAGLVADVSEFMTLSPGDVLMLGVAAGAPCVRVGQHVAIEADGIGRLQFRVAEGEVRA